MYPYLIHVPVERSPPSPVSSHDPPPAVAGGYIHPWARLGRSRRARRRTAIVGPPSERRPRDLRAGYGGKCSVIISEISCQRDLGGGECGVLRLAVGDGHLVFSARGTTTRETLKKQYNTQRGVYRGVWAWRVWACVVHYRSRLEINPLPALGLPRPFRRHDG